MEQRSTSSGFPLSGLLALAMTGFIAIMTETLPSGLLPSISQGLNVSLALAGQLVTLYALGSMLAAIPLVALTRSWGRRSALLAAIIGFFLFNTVTAVSSHYTLTLVARFLAGAAAGLAWGLLAGCARRMVPPHQQGRAMAIAMVGTPIALALGVPLGAWLGTVVSWRTVFAVISGLTLLLIGWVVLKVPNFPGQKTGEMKSIVRVLTTPGIRPILSVIVLWILAHNVLYTYIAPFLAPAGISNQVDSVLLVFGVSALAGIWITGLVVDRWLRRGVLVSVGIFALTSLVLGLAGTSPSVIYLCMVFWGLTFGGAATLLQTASADAAGSGADVAQSMIVVAWNLAIASGGIVGGILLHSVGVTSFPWILLALLIVGWIIAWQSHQYGFKPGTRTESYAVRCECEG
ncbi:MFS transporter [Brenneria goodwinii]|uniref:MFS transporter n=1 Tax=Brenneria goodwinii TaxID=1109412 RepID=UPI000EF195BE|nr:MFS transporter [Brenneria goodwinii]MCG8155851.1 MFS transporter [Brenneria goodwinii]MCG8160683.1 MFS transporter [Brenneria goodwinii]MCG8166879.1 MFS transporter [Brenneria goodwinii]MCG8172825.1 MFS transporter [Brenneria goodwinii]MCG8177224.1 MFS transporter [Brenneria goodwinii]